MDIFQILLCKHELPQTSQFSLPILAENVEKSLGETHPLIKLMAMCHSLTQIDGEIRGDILDVKLFEASGWSLVKNEVCKFLYISTIHK